MSHHDLLNPVTFFIRLFVELCYCVPSDCMPKQPALAAPWQPTLAAPSNQAWMHLLPAPATSPGCTWCRVWRSEGAGGGQVTGGYGGHSGHDSRGQCCGGCRRCEGSRAWHPWRGPEPPPPPHTLPPPPPHTLQERVAPGLAGVYLEGLWPGPAQPSATQWGGGGWRRSAGCRC